MSLQTLNEKRLANDSRQVTLKTNVDYTNYIARLHSEAAALRIKILDMSCDYDNLITLIQKMKKEQNEKFSKAITTQVKKAIKRSRNKS